MNHNILIGWIAGILNAAIYAFAAAAYQSQKIEMQPITMNCIRMWAALPVMSVLVLFPFTDSPLLIHAEVVVILALSVILGSVIADTAYLASQRRIGVSYALPIAMTFPVFTFIFAVIFCGESVVLMKLLGVVITVVGVMTVSREQGKDDDTIQESKSLDIIGILLAIATAILYAACTILLQMGLGNTNPVTAHFSRVLIGSMSLLPMFIFASSKGMPAPSRRPTKIIAVAGIFGMALISLMYIVAVKYVGGVVTSVIGSTTPLFALPMSMHFLKEKLTSRAVLGVLATVVGVVIVVLPI